MGGGRERPAGGAAGLAELGGRGSPHVACGTFARACKGEAASWSASSAGFQVADGRTHCAVPRTGHGLPCPGCAESCASACFD